MGSLAGRWELFRKAYWGARAGVLSDAPASVDASRGAQLPSAVFETNRDLPTNLHLP